MVGGVRRSALISLSDLNDREMRFAKSGQWWEQNVQRALANNSVNYKEKPDVGTFMREWLSLYDSKSGERGIYNSMSAQRTVERINGRYRDGSGDYIEDEIPERTHQSVARSFFVLNFNLLKSLSEEMTLGISQVQNIQLSRSNPLLLSSSTSQESGNEIVMKNDYCEYHYRNNG